MVFGAVPDRGIFSTVAVTGLAAKSSAEADSCDPPNRAAYTSASGENCGPPLEIQKAERKGQLAEHNERCNSEKIVAVIHCPLHLINEEKGVHG